MSSLASYITTSLAVVLAMDYFGLFGRADADRVEPRIGNSAPVVQTGFVEWTHKGDRLFRAGNGQQLPTITVNISAIANTTLAIMRVVSPEATARDPPRRQIGCDPLFSPLVTTSANPIGRCLTENVPSPHNILVSSIRTAT